MNRRIQSRAAIVRVELAKLYRFREAQFKPKLHLYKALIQPLITYAPSALELGAKSNIRELQIIQNKALRWIFNTKWHEFIKNTELHERARIPPLNIYWRELFERQVERFQIHHTHWIDYFGNLLGIDHPDNIFNIQPGQHPVPIY